MSPPSSLARNRWHMIGCAVKISRFAFLRSSRITAVLNLYVPLELYYTNYTWYWRDLERNCVSIARLIDGFFFSETSNTTVWGLFVCYSKFMKCPLHNLQNDFMTGRSIEFFLNCDQVWRVTFEFFYVTCLPWSGLSRCSRGLFYLFPYLNVF